MTSEGLPDHLLTRWKAKISVDAAGCWIWTAGIDIHGYGKTTVTGRPRGRATVGAHRAIYEFLRGPVPDGLQLDHLCRVRNCVNPDHLEPVTGRVNILRGTSSAARFATVTHCKYGHPYSGANLRIITINGKFKQRACRACARIKAAAWRARRAVG